MTRWVLIVSGTIPFVFFDDAELDARDDVVEVIELGHGDLDVVLVDPCSACGACER